MKEKLMFYTVHLVNFDHNPNSMHRYRFKSESEAVDHAKSLGFECAIWKHVGNEVAVHIRDVSPLRP